MAERPNLATQVEVVRRELTSLVELLSTGTTVGVSADHIAAVEAAGRLMDAARVHVIAPLAGDNVAADRLGFASPVAAIASIARISERSARARLRVAHAVCPDTTLTGAPLSAPHLIVRDALDAGDIGLDAATLIATELASLTGRAPTDVLDIAESAMVGLATGLSPTGEIMVASVSVDYLAGELRQIAAAADPDGARPREERATRRREFRLGMADNDGLVPVNGRLKPEIGSLLAALLEAHRRSPRFADHSSPHPVESHDLTATALSATDLTATDLTATDLTAADARTPAQRRHDAFAEMIIAASQREGAPRLDGAPVAVLVTVAESDLANPIGLDGDAIATMAGSSFPVSRRSVERFIDAGGYRIATLNKMGAVTGISSLQRCFTPAQRLSIAGRDGARCATPGCASAHYTLQAHHVIPYRDDGPTSVNNGILLCYWHHQQVDTGPWSYRMINGIPQVRGPGISEWTPARRPMRRAA